jgi:hypothetical protein
MDAWLDNFARANFARSTDTAHDLKTPLNVAVLNLELLRMRIARLGLPEGDEKITAYSQAIELELRRMARIFDAFFLLSTPPKDEGEPGAIDLCALCREAAETAGARLTVAEPLPVRAHESRIRPALRLFFEGAGRLIPSERQEAHAGRDGDQFRIRVSGLRRNEPDLEKIFKFYYTDPSGNPDLALASARLIAETYGGELIVTEERDNVVTLRLSFPGDHQ